MNIQRIEAPSRETFFSEFVNKNTPVILTGVADEWPALTSWTPEYFKEVAGDSLITVHFNESGNFHEWYLNHQKRVDLRIPLSELLDKLATEEGSRYYMTEHNVDLISTRLLEDVDFLPWIIDNNPTYQPLLFLGRDTCMPLHYHGTTEALLCQLHGVKRVRLFAPGQFDKLYPQPWYSRSPLFAQVNGADPDLARFPRYADAEPLDFQLHPGEILFIPVHWWHLTNVEGFQVSTTRFWDARVANWTFPTPGLQIAARELMYQTQRGVRGVRRRLGRLRRVVAG